MMLKRATLLLFTIFLIANLAGQFARFAFAKSPRKQERSTVVRLGERLFRDDRFSTPRGDLPASCSHCHLLDEDPQGLRAYADFFNRSWVSSRMQDHRRLELRNSPTIFDVAGMPRLHFDGEFASLEDLVKGTLAGRPMGWLPGEEAQAVAHLRSVLLDDKGEGRSAGGPYRDQFRKTFGVDLEKTSGKEAFDLVAKAVADYMRTLNTRQDSPYDRFIALNGLAGKPDAGESNAAYARRLMAAIESKRALKFPKNFDASALRGMIVFFTDGNCVACHAPPLFTDNAFHNIGISQREYDGLHGEGSFAALPIPGAADARRPSPQFREIPAKDRPGLVDLGFWNFVDLKTSPLRRAGESDDRFLRRTIAAFKTPGLRNLKYTQPYFHDGSTHTLEAVLDELIRLSDLARAGRIREADDELAKIKVYAPDIAPLAAFLNSLNEDLKRGF
jgi:cytochrome c peroxidase